MSDIIKKAKIDYLPTKCYVNDIIYVYYNNKVIKNKETFIYPDLSWEWEYPECIYYEETNNIILKPVSHCEALYFEYICVKDHQDTIIFEEENYSLEDTNIELAYVGAESQGTTIQFTLSYTINSSEYTVVSDEIPADWRTTYDITVVNPPLIVMYENQLKLTAINSKIETGSILTFKSNYGLDTTAELIESNTKPVDKEATVDYIPEESDMTDTITVSYEDTVIFTKDLYINPIMTFEWNLPEYIYSEEVNIISFKYTGTEHSTTSSIVIDSFKVSRIKDVIFSAENYELQYNTFVDIEYTPSLLPGQKINFTISYTYMGIDYTFDSPRVEVRDRE